MKKSFLAGFNFNCGASIVRLAEAMTAMLGLGAPAAIGYMAGRPELGIIASLGGLALSGEGKGESFKERVFSLSYAVITGCLAIFAGSRLEALGWSLWGLPILATVAALVGSLSRLMARATTQFILFAIIAANIGGPDAHATGAAALFFLWASWTALLSLSIRPLMLKIFRVQPPAAAPTQSYTRRQYFRRWRWSLTRLAGWQYTIRLSSCLIAAHLVQWRWPDYHTYWVALTVVIVVHRNLQEALSRTIHRAAGTALGMVFMSLLMFVGLPVWGVVAMIGLLAAMRPVLLETNYFIYAAVQTPLVLLLLDFGQDPSWELALTRLLATLAGCLIALTLGYLGWSRFTPLSPVSTPAAAPVTDSAPPTIAQLANEE
ncbi:FUSC family protein [Desulfatibacillum aliphaticivorans]|uniref:FUSC family protein n=1 Tax=Desulfatibacillum aliphaticivorans TaxID=218208 RepID=UPI0004042824|nr:FUSC family protein [Desulfatibacillum aliphaticivorans]